MKRCTALLLIGMILVLPFSDCRADRSTAQFLLVGQGARAEAMGRSVVADCCDYTAPYWNPAGLGFLRQGEIGFINTQFPTRIDNNFLSIVYPYKQVGIGLSMTMFTSYMDFYDGSSAKIGSGAGEKDINYNTTFAFRAAQHLSLGVNCGETSVDVYNSFGDNYKDRAFYASAGGLYRDDRFSLGMSMYTGGELTMAHKEKQPEFFRVGAAYRALDEREVVMTCGYEQHANDTNANAVGLGVEWHIVDNFFLRSGYNYNQHDTVNNTMSYGFGIKSKKYVLDYAFTPRIASLDDMDVHRFAFAFKFGALHTRDGNIPTSPPEITIQYLKNESFIMEPTRVYTVLGSNITLLATILADPIATIDSIAIKRNGSTILKREYIDKRKYCLNEKIPLVEGENILEIIATDSAQKTSWSEKIVVVYEKNILKGNASIKEFIDFVANKSKQWAVLIGVDQYPTESGLPPLVDVMNDVTLLKKTLLTHVQNFVPEHIFTLGEGTCDVNDACTYVGPATKHNIESFLGDQLPLKVKKDDTVIIFFSGHGITIDPSHNATTQGFLVPIDGKKDQPFATCISMDFIKQISERLSARQILFIIDACNSGLVLVRNKGDNKKESSLKQRIASFWADCRQAMTAGQSTQATQVSSKFQKSVYTHYLVEGLSGKADADKDGIISILELHTYVHSKVSTETNNEQIPQMGRLPDGGEGDFFFIEK